MTMRDYWFGFLVGVAAAATSQFVYRHVAPSSYCYSTGGHLLGFAEDNKVVCITRY